MNTVLSRANAIFAFTLSVLAALTFCCFVSTAFNDYKSNITLRTVKAVVKNVPDYSASREKNDLGFVTFDLHADSLTSDRLCLAASAAQQRAEWEASLAFDLTPLFNWNVKQLFIYLTAEYQTESNKLNQVVLWDKIIQRGEPSFLDFKNLNTKYYFWDDGNGLRANKNVTLTLSWNIIPNAGSLPNIVGDGSNSFTFPLEYTTSRI